MWKLALVFSWIDWVYLLLLFWFLLKGFQKGLLQTFGETFRIGMILFLSLSYLRVLAALIEKYTLIPLSYAKIISYLGVMFAGYILFRLVGKIFSWMMNIGFNSTVDRLGGLVMGGLQYSLTLTFLILLVMLFPLKLTYEQVYQKSFLGKRVVRFWVGKMGEIERRVQLYTRKPSLGDFNQETLTTSLDE